MNHNSMEKLNEYLQEIQDLLNDINSLMEKVSEDKMSYNTAKEIRKNAQAIKIASQNIRETTTELFKSINKKK